MIIWRMTTHHQKFELSFSTLNCPEHGTLSFSPSRAEGWHLLHLHNILADFASHGIFFPKKSVKREDFLYSECKKTTILKQNWFNDMIFLSPPLLAIFKYRLSNFYEYYEWIKCIYIFCRMKSISKQPGNLDVPLHVPQQGLVPVLNTREKKKHLLYW